MSPPQFRTPLHTVSKAMGVECSSQNKRQHSNSIFLFLKVLSQFKCLLQPWKQRKMHDVILVASLELFHCVFYLIHHLIIIQESSPLQNLTTLLFCFSISRRERWLGLTTMAQSQPSINTSSKKNVQFSKLWLHWRLFPHVSLDLRNKELTREVQSNNPGRAAQVVTSLHASRLSCNIDARKKFRRSVWYLRPLQPRRTTLCLLRRIHLSWPRHMEVPPRSSHREERIVSIT